MGFLPKFNRLILLRKFIVIVKFYVISSKALNFLFFHQKMKNEPVKLNTKISNKL
jgi:hypothetical protein